MTDVKGPSATPGKLAMSRALGAAFLSHQVEQLEKSVAIGSNGANWRERDRPRSANMNGTGPVKGSVPKPKRAERERRSGEANAPHAHGRQRNSGEGGRPDRDADVIVVDASVLIHTIHVVKKWCKDGRQEVVIIPLEALNTLDLLKKGSTALAQKARTASRLLESQVGTNPRIRVQQDDAFVPWDSIAFAEHTPDDTAKANPQHQLGGVPEWVRQTICCARWEVEHAARAHKEQPAPGRPPRIVLALLAAADAARMEPGSTASPVPLPAPQVHANKYEPRSTGALVAHWAARAGVVLHEVRPGGPPPGRVSSEDERPARKAGGPQLVERPPAVKAMMDVVAQPSKVVRVLARGEKLDPDS